MRSVPLIILILMVFFAGCGKKVIEPSRYKTPRNQTESAGYGEMEVVESPLYPDPEEDSGTDIGADGGTEMDSLSQGQCEGYSTFQAGSFGSQANADALKQDLTANGFTVDIESSQAGAGSVFRVYATHEGTEEQVKNLLAGAGIMEPIPVQTRCPEGAAANAVDSASGAGALEGDAMAMEQVTYQAGSFSDYDNANGLKQILDAKGFTSRVEEVQEGEAVHYRVIADYHGSDDEARAKLIEAGVTNPLLLSRASTSSLQREEEPYTGPKPGQLTFQVGAFGSMENAQTLKTALEARGFTVHIQETGAAYRVLASRSGTEEEIRAILAEEGIFNPLRQ